MGVDQVVGRHVIPSQRRRPHLRGEQWLQGVHIPEDLSDLGVHQRLGREGPKTPDRPDWLWFEEGESGRGGHRAGEKHEKTGSEDTSARGLHPSAFQANLISIHFWAVWAELPVYENRHLATNMCLYATMVASLAAYLELDPRTRRQLLIWQLRK